MKSSNNLGGWWQREPTRAKTMRQNKTACLGSFQADVPTYNDQVRGLHGGENNGLRNHTDEFKAQPCHLVAGRRWESS